MSKAEEIHYKAVMAADNQEPPKDYAISAHADHFNGFVEGYIEGYHQAEKDNKLTWEDIHTIAIIEDKLIHELCLNDQTLPHTKEFFEEVLKRFKEGKEKTNGE